jgi:hypothetical protein
MTADQKVNYPGETMATDSTEPSGTHGRGGKLGGCKMCALRLARIVGQRHWWFFLVREPLVLGMRLLAWCNRIDRRQHVAPNPECNGCIRFMKNELEAKSSTFRFLNGIIGDPFSRLRNARLTAEEVSEAKRHAAQAMQAEDLVP